MFLLGDGIIPCTSSKTVVFSVHKFRGIEKKNVTFCPSLIFIVLSHNYHENYLEASPCKVTHRINICHSLQLVILRVKSKELNIIIESANSFKKHLVSHVLPQVLGFRHE